VVTTGFLGKRHAADARGHAEGEMRLCSRTLSWKISPKGIDSVVAVCNALAEAYVRALENRP
jgi:hypothetical protein